MTSTKDFIESLIKSLSYARSMLAADPSPYDIQRARKAIDDAKSEAAEAIKQLNEARSRL